MTGHLDVPGRHRASWRKCPVCRAATTPPVGPMRPVEPVMFDRAYHSNGRCYIETYRIVNGQRLGRTISEPCTDS